MQSAPDYSTYRSVIEALLNGNEPLPRLPPMTAEIRKAMEQQNLSMVDLSRLLARDAELSAVLLKYASSPLIGAQTPPQNLMDVLRLLGMNQVERITMVHSIKSLFNVQSANHRRLFSEAWRRLALKASLSTFIAKQLHLKKVSPDTVLMVALLSEVGTLAVLSALKNAEQSPDLPTATPDLPTYIKLCREYAKPLGILTLKQWDVDEQYIEVIQHVGDWKGESTGAMNIADVINLGLFHSLKLSSVKTDLPPLQEITAYQKLEAPANKIITGGLDLVMTNIQEIRVVAKNLF